MSLTVVTLGPAQAVTIEVGASYPRPREITIDMRVADYSGGGSGSGFRDTTPRKPDFEEYDAGDFETSPRRTTDPNAATSTSQTRSSTTQSKAAGKAPEPAPAPLMNLLDFDDSEPVAAASASALASTAAGKDKALPALAPLTTNENGVLLSLVSGITICPRMCDKSVATMTLQIFKPRRPHPLQPPPSPAHL